MGGSEDLENLNELTDAMAGLKLISDQENYFDLLWGDLW